jgi:hypothetical protein
MRARSPWLDEKRGYLADWLTQQWVRATGSRVLLDDHPWLDGPVGPTDRIGPDFFATFAGATGLRIATPGGARGLMPSFDALRTDEFDPDSVAPAVRRFYERTAEYRLDVDAAWSRSMRPIGSAVAAVFSRRLEQLNLPLSPPAASAGMVSSIVVLEDPDTGQVRYTAWVRRDRRSGETIYAASYSVTALPGHDARFVKVVFPLPNGFAMVLLRPTVLDDRSLLLESRGLRFGDPGFYFLVRAPAGGASVRYVRTFHEAIRVFVDPEATLRTDHDFFIWGRRFLRLHYAMPTDVR